MATVYLACDVKHDRQVALKVLHHELAAALGPERFLREIRIAARLRHPNIVPLYDSGEANGLLYYVMPFVEGESLRDRLRRQPQLPVDEALGVAREVADALTHAHGRDLIHRDIKPENILLEAGHALVADFGIARAVGSAVTTQLTETGLVIGTPAYMSPEQALGDAAVDARSDVYALGCVLYEMLAGEPPFVAPTAGASIARRLTEPAPQIRRIREGVPAAVEQSIMVALARDPADRFPSATAFRDALVGGQEIPDHAQVQPTRRITRRAVLATAAAGAVVALGVAIALPQIARSRAESRTVPASASNAVPGIAVLPFRTTGADPELWHEGIVDMLSYNLDGLGQLRKIDPVTVLTRWRQMGGSASSALTVEDAREVGRRLGSRYVVTGRAVQIGADVQLIAEVQDVESGKPRGAVRVTGPGDSVPSLVDGLTLELLRRNLLPTDGQYRLPGLSRATTSSLPALKEYLAGERQYRRGQFRDAVPHYQRAIEADSNFASAWFRLAGACGWGGCGPSSQPAEDYAKRALALVGQLPDRDAKRIRAYENVEALEALTETYPDDLEAWIALGESYFHHFGGATLRPTQAYRGAFGRAVRLHPYYGEAYGHLIEDAFLRLDSLDAQELINSHVALGADGSCSYQVSHDLVWGTPAARERAMAVLDTVTLANCVQTPPAAPAHVLDRMAQIYGHMVDTATQAGARKFALSRLLQVRVPNGQITSARRALARMADVPVTNKTAARWAIQLHLSGFPDSAAARHLARVLAAEATPTDNFWLGALAISQGRWSDVEAVRRALGRQTQSVEGGRSSPGANARAYATVLGAYAGLVRGDRTKLAGFDSALVQLPVFGNDIQQPQVYLRYQVGKLLFDDGQLAEAERYLWGFMPYDFFYTSQAELYLGRIAEARGRREEAVTHYARFVRWWRHADEPLRPQWEEARQALSRLAAE